MTRAEGESLPPDALLAAYPEPMAALAQELRAVVLRAAPGAVERVRVGWRVIGYDLPLKSRGAYFAWIMPEPEHVHLGFPRGVLLDDPTGVLEGRGITKSARWFTLRDQRDLADEHLAAFVRSAAALATMLTAARPRSWGRDRDGPYRPSAGPS